MLACTQLQNQFRGQHAVCCPTGWNSGFKTRTVLSWGIFLEVDVACEYALLSELLCSNLLLGIHHLLAQTALSLAIFA